MSSSNLFGGINEDLIARSRNTTEAYFERSGTTVFGKEAKSNTRQTQSNTISLYRNSPVRFQATGSIDTLHFTTPGVVKKKDQVMAKVTTPINDPRAERMGTNAPAASNTPFQRCYTLSTC
jgi:hypothetical protein